MIVSPQLLVSAFKRFFIELYMFGRSFGIEMIFAYRITHLRGPVNVSCMQQFVLSFILSVLRMH